MVLLDISSGWESFVQLISVLLIFLFVLVITYATTKWIARYQQGSMNNKNMRVLETMRVTNSNFIQIVQVGEKYLVIAVCKDNMSVLTELTEEEFLHLPVQTEMKNDSVSESFQEILSRLKEKIPRK